MQRLEKDTQSCRGRAVWREQPSRVCSQRRAARRVGSCGEPSSDATAASSSAGSHAFPALRQREQLGVRLSRHLGPGLG